MLCNKTSVELSSAELNVITAALQTQEKILSVQSLSGDTASRNRLDDIQSVMRSLQRQSPDRPPVLGLGERARSLFS